MWWFSTRQFLKHGVLAQDGILAGSKGLRMLEVFNQPSFRNWKHPSASGDF